MLVRLSLWKDVALWLMLEIMKALGVRYLSVMVHVAVQVMVD
jgi:hypothetical protein